MDEQFLKMFVNVYKGHEYVEDNQFVEDDHRNRRSFN